MSRSDREQPTEEGAESADGNVEGSNEWAGGSDDDPASTDVPDWDDEYVDRVSDRLMFHYDLEKDRRVRGESFTLYGRLRMETQKQFLHPSITYGHHRALEHLFVERSDRPTRGDVERFVDLGHALADEWIEADEEHYSTDFTFALVVPEIPDDVRRFVSGFTDRTLLKYGYFGHYEIHLLVVAPEERAIVSSARADAADAFRTWDPIETERGFVTRLVRRLWDR